MTEFGAAATNNDHRGSTAVAVAASARLAQRKREAVARRNREEREEAALERRVADVAEAARFAAERPDDDCLGDVVPRARHPGNDAAEEDRGRGRDANFVRFQDLGGKDGFLSALVSDHASEGRHQTISHKSRALLKNNNVSRKRNKTTSSSSLDGSMLSSRRQGRHSHTTNLDGRKFVKKSKKSKWKY